MLGLFAGAGVSGPALGEIALGVATMFGAALVFLRGRKGDIDDSVNSRVHDLIEGQGGYADRLAEANAGLNARVEKVQAACNECLSENQRLRDRIAELEHEVAQLRSELE